MEKFTTRFFDGQHFQPISVEVEFDGHRIRIHSLEPEKPLNIVWPVKEVGVIVEAYAQTPGKLNSKSMPDARLIIEDKHIYEIIKSKLKRGAIAASSTPHSWKKLFFIFWVTMLFVIGILLAIPFFAKVLAPFVPESVENKFGQIITDVIVNEQTQVCVAPDGQKALEKVLKTLQTAHSSDAEFTVMVVDNNIQNALTTSGHNIIIFKGLFEITDSADAFTGILGHEMAHAYLKHINQAIIRQLTYQIILATVIGDFSSLANNMIAMNFSQQQELEADNFSIHLLNNTQISPEGLAQAFEAFHENEDTSILNEYFSSHPASLSRVDNVRAQIQTDVDYQPSLSKKEWAALKNICSETIMRKDIKK